MEKIFTGISDKNGIPVNVGDIIKCDCSFEFCFVDDVFDFLMFFYSILGSSEKKLQVIGNVKEDPGLVFCIMYKKYGIKNDRA